MWVGGTAHAYRVSHQVDGSIRLTRTDIGSLRVSGLSSLVELTARAGTGGSLLLLLLLRLGPLLGLLLRLLGALPLHASVLEPYLHLCLWEHEATGHLEAFGPRQILVLLELLLQLEQLLRCEGGAWSPRLAQNGVMRIRSQFGYAMVQHASSCQELELQLGGHEVMTHGDLQGERDGDARMSLKSLDPVSLWGLTGMGLPEGSRGRWKAEPPCVSSW